MQLLDSTSSPLSDSSLIQTIIDPTILKVVRARNGCPNFENAWITIVKLDGVYLPHPSPPDLFRWCSSSDSTWSKAPLYGAKLLSLHNLTFSKRLVWNSSNWFNSQISKITENVFLGLFLFFINRNACYFFSINCNTSITTANGFLHPFNTS